MKYRKQMIAAVDAGTTGVRCCIFDDKGNEISGGYFKVPTFYPGPGLVEQSPETIVELAYQSVAAAISNNDIDSSDIIGLCITAQRNGFVPIDTEGNFLSNMFVWQDQRGASVHSWMRSKLIEKGMSPEDLYLINGQPFGTFQSGNKVIWLRNYQNDLYNKTYKLATPHAFLVKAFGSGEYLDEKNDVGCWLVADANTQRIDKDLCNIFELDANKFLEAVLPGTRVGTVSEAAAKKTGLLQGTPVYMESGDQQCGSLGAGNYGTRDMVTVCMGTAGLCMAYSPEPIRHPKCKCNIQGHPAGGYTLESHSSSCMSSFVWVRDLIFTGEADGKNLSDRDVNRLATDQAKMAPTGSNGVIFLPWLQGAECPHYDEKARGAFVGMTLATRKSEMIRASMEGICFENRMMIETLQQADGLAVKTIRILGGVTNNEFWNQMQADIYGMPVETVTTNECTALGAAIICAVASNIYDGYEEAVEEMVHLKQRYLPDEFNKERYNKLYDVWDRCYYGLSRECYHKIQGLQDFVGY